MDLLSGKTLYRANGSSVSADVALANKKVILFYFSAHWCPPCRAFTPVLKDFYDVRFF
jgi:nucleoredoxin